MGSEDASRTSGTPELAAAKTRAEYFSAVDGLRALAVASVVIYHLNGLLPGGFVGVDIFFVISGFVVAHSARHLPVATARAFMLAFYARRLMRIAPALIVCVVLSSLATVLLVPNAWLSEANARTGLAALFGLSNYVLALSANDYWAPRAEFNPFTHTWSLGVEEQFYFLAPLLFLAWCRGHGRRTLQVLLGLGLLSLLAAAVAPLMQQQSLAFYSIHTRFWELACGVALAMTQHRWRPYVAARTPGMGRALAVLALTLVFVSLGFANARAFPWPWALAPVLGSALLLLLVVARPASGLGRFFGSVPLVWLGRLSYSLYLWHWPVFVLMRWTVGIDSLPLKAVALALALVLAMASLRFVEQPFRHGWPASGRTPARTVVRGLAALALAVTVSGSLWLARPWLSLSVTSAPDWSWETDLPAPAARCDVGITKEKPAGGLLLVMQPVACQGVAAVAEPPARLFVLGDSHAGAYTALLKKLVRTEGTTVRLYTYAGCSVFGLAQPMQAASPACQKFAEQALAAIERDARPGDVLFLPGLRVPRLGDQWQPFEVAPAEAPARRAEAAEEAQRRLQPLAARGVAVVFEAPKPVFAVPPFRCADVFNAGNPICSSGQTTPRPHMEALRAPVLAGMAQVVRGLPRAAIFDPFPVLCPGETCEPFKQGRPMFLDGDHLSGHGNELLFPGFLSTLKRAAHGPTATH